LTHFSFQLLGCGVEIACEDLALTERFRYVANRAEQPVAIRQTLRYRVAGSGPFAIQQDGDPLDEVAGPDDALFVVYRSAYGRAIERMALAGWVVFHGILARIGGKRHLILGPKGAGKSTLATRLLFDGHSVEGDELALGRGDEMVAFPRRFHLKPGIERNVPEIEALLADLPNVGERDPILVTGLDPTELGFAWRLERGPIDRIVVITPHHGGATRLHPLEPHRVIERLLQSSFRWGESRSRLLGAASRLGGGGGWGLELGSAKDAAQQLVEASARSA
jgi:hypothetical protein